MKTSELTGPALNWAVAKCEKAEMQMPYYQPSTDWSQGGPIIEQERIGVAFNGGQWVAFYMLNELNEYDWDFKLSVYGPTPLIAAMRCYVASKLGDTVEVPDELCPPPTKSELLRAYAQANNLPFTEVKLAPRPTPEDMK